MARIDGRSDGEKMEATEPRWVRSVRQISADGVDPHLRRVFAPGSNPSPTAPQANTPKTGSTHPGWMEHPNQAQGKSVTSST
jgi:hypothetical protein